MRSDSGLAQHCLLTQNKNMNLHRDEALTDLSRAMFYVCPCQLSDLAKIILLKQV